METQEVKEINLLYSNWEGNIILPNASEMGIEFTQFSDFAGYLSSHLNSSLDTTKNRKFKINRINIDDYNPDTQYFYAISHPNMWLTEILDYCFPINGYLVELSNKYNNIHFIFSYEHEGDSCDTWGKLVNYINYFGMDASKFIVINNNSKIYEHKEQYSLDITVHKSNFILHSFSKVLEYVESDFKEDKEGKFFMCRNRSPKDHRISLLIKLFNDGILNEINYSYIPEKEARRANVFSVIKYLGVSFYKEHTTLINDIANHTKVDDYELEKNWINPDNNDFQSDQDPIFLVPELSTSFENSYVNIVTESLYDASHEVVHHSEKSFRPFFYYQFPIFLASPHHVKFLRTQYGFDMFDDIINHDYDYCLDDVERMNMVIEQIKIINERKDEFILFYKNNKDRFIKNREILMQVAKESKQKDVDFLWDFL